MKKNSRSRELAFILRHGPEKVESSLDSSGWMPVQDLLKHGWTMTEISDIVETDNKGRYELSGDSRKIRALQGHSVPGIFPDLVPWDGKNVLYHGTQSQFLESIYSKGLLGGSREYVHLSQDLKTAWGVASRRGVKSAVVLKVDVTGLGALVSKNGVVLVKTRIPETCILEVIYDRT